MLSVAGSKFWDKEAMEVAWTVVAQDKVPEPLVFKKPLVVWEEGKVYVWLLRVRAPLTEAVPNTSKVVSGVESPIPTLPEFGLNINAPLPVVITPFVWS